MIKAITRDSSGVSPLKENGKLLTETAEKVNALNRQFQSVFTSETSTSKFFRKQISSNYARHPHYSKGS